MNAISTNWLPPLWRRGDGDDGYQDEPWSVTDVDAAVKTYQKQGYLTAARKLTPKAESLDKASAKYRSIVDAAHNVNALRNAWNTPSKAWLLLASFMPKGHEFTVDPFWNPGAMGLPALEHKLDGSSSEQDGYAIDPSRNADVLASLKARGIAGPDDTELAKHEGFPLNWRGAVKKGHAAAAVNGPHSDTAEWLPLCDAYGQEEFCGAFVPYNGDVWLWNIGFRASIVIHLGRSRCSPPPGIGESSPRGASLVVLWIPRAWADPNGPKYGKLPKHTRRVLEGESFKVPYYRDKQGRPRYVVVHPGNVTETVDLGLLEIEGRT